MISFHTQKSLIYLKSHQNLFSKLNLSKQLTRKQGRLNHVNESYFKRFLDNSNKMCQFLFFMLYCSMCAKDSYTNLRIQKYRDTIFCNFLIFRTRYCRYADTLSPHRKKALILLSQNPCSPSPPRPSRHL
jgi:hypothetical protein